MDPAAPRSLDPRVLTLWRISAVVAVFVLVAVAIVLEFLAPSPPGLIAGPVALVIGAWALWYPAARYRRWSYRLRAHDLVLNYGVVTHIEQLVPRTRIQHVDLIGGPIERAIGLRHLKVFTAGTRMADVAIPGLATSQAELLRAELLSWIEPAEADD